MKENNKKRAMIHQHPRVSTKKIIGRARSTIYELCAAGCSCLKLIGFPLMHGSVFIPKIGDEKKSKKMWNSRRTCNTLNAVFNIPGNYLSCWKERACITWEDVRKMGKQGMWGGTRRPPIHRPWNKLSCSSHPKRLTQVSTNENGQKRCMCHVTRTTFLTL